MTEEPQEHDQTDEEFYNGDGRYDNDYHLLYEDSDWGVLRTMTDIAEAAATVVVSLFRH